MRTATGLLAVLLLVAALAARANIAYGPPTFTHTSLDLNGDGTADSISLTNMKESGEFTLQVGAASNIGKLNGKPEGFSIIDLDRADKYKELDVWQHGDSDYDDHLLYWYDGKVLRLMGHLRPWPTYPGNATVLLRTPMGFWEKTEKYRGAGATRVLQLMPQEFYYVKAFTKTGQAEATVRVSVPIFRTRTTADVVAHLRPNSMVLILLCDTSPKGQEDDWYLIKTESGLLGWVRHKTIEKALDGLSWAG